jgi:uncharacterized protein (DUF983 family)
MAKLGTDHELGAAVGAGLSHLCGRSGKGCLHRRFEHARRPPKLLPRIVNYFSHKR